MQLQKTDITKIVEASLAEDIDAGDITTDNVISDDAVIEFSLNAREKMVLCGLEVAYIVFRQLDSNIELNSKFKDGDILQAGDKILLGKGDARDMLKAERVALNLLQNMCGVASITREFVDKIKASKAKILDTRKTIPGLRILQKYAVNIGGGCNHRMNLNDAIMIKDNHIAIAGGVEKAITNVRSNYKGDKKIQLECDTLDQVEQALNLGVDMLLLDNMSIDQLNRAVELNNGRAVLEASGGVNIDNVAAIAATDVDYISIGRLTSMPRSVDIGLDIKFNS